jgi:branched-chain amino acid aminotransferase
MNEVIYVNGTLLPKEQAKISVLDYGFMYGYGLFETMRAYNNKIFRLDDHLTRLYYSGQILGISVDVEEVKQAVLDTVRANPLAQARVRVAVSAGEGSTAPDISTHPTLVVLVTEYKPLSRVKYNQGFTTIVTPIRRNNRSPVVHVKSANSIENMLASQQARRKGADEAIFFNERNYLAEAAWSNVFIVSKGDLKTPRVEAGILPGVTRAIILRLAQELRLKVFESNLKIDDVLCADEMFLTNTMREVMPVCQVAGKLIGDGKPGTVTKQLMRAYRKLVEKETA